MAVLCQDIGVRHMVAFFIDIFGVRALRAIPDKSQGFKFSSIRLHDIAVIDMHDRFIWDLFTDGRQIGVQSFCGDAFVQVSGEPFHRIDLFGILMKLADNICQEAAAGSEYVVGYISGKLPVRFWQLSGNLPQKG